MYEPYKRRSGFPWRALLIIAIVAAVIYAAIRLLAGDEKKEAPQPPPPLVTVEPVHVADIPLVFDYPARLAGSREVEIRPRVSGILQQRFYTEGDFVKRGDTLFQIDPKPFYAELARAKAGLGQASGDYRRAQQLMKSKALSAREFDQARAMYGQAAALVETAEINLAYTTVRAPISGFTSEEGFSEGSLVTADTSVLTRLTQLDPIYVEYAFPESDAMLQRRGVAEGLLTLPADGRLQVAMVFNDGSTYPREATVRFTDSFIDPATGTVRARAVLTNNDGGLMPGQFVQARVKGLVAKGAISVPEKAIMQGPMGMFVYTVTAENKAKITPVKLGILNNDHQFVHEGLREGDRVITEGMIKVRPDAPIKIDTGANKEPQQGQPAQHGAPADGAAKGGAAADGSQAGSEDDPDVPTPASTKGVNQGPDAAKE